MIITKFCTRHDSYAALAYANIYCCLMTRIGITTKLNFHQIWIVMEKLIVKWTPNQWMKDSYLSDKYPMSVKAPHFTSHSTIFQNLIQAYNKETIKALHYFSFVLRIHQQMWDSHSNQRIAQTVPVKQVHVHLMMSYCSSLQDLLITVAP